MKRLTVLVLAAIISITACSESSHESPLEPTRLTPEADASFGFWFGGVARVTNSANSGNGSFRAAIAQANNNSSIRRIEFAHSVSTIWLDNPITYTGAQSLDIDGNRATLDGSGLGAGEPAFLANGGGNLSLSSLTVRNAPDQGIKVQIPPGSTGTKKFLLFNLVATGNNGHGVEINDQLDPIVIDPAPPNPAGSDAAVEVVVVGSRFDSNGFGALDRDGLRVNEGGNGNLVVSVTLSRANSNGADGVELDERGPGDVIFSIFASHFARTGDFDQSVMPDKDDGFDIDESNDGSVIGKVILSSANNNFEEGFDFNENDAGDFKVDMTLVEASGNTLEGIDFEEDDDFQGGGHLITTLVGIKTNGNGVLGDAGLKIRERGEGNLDAKVIGAETSNNLSAGIGIREQQGGNLVANIQNANANGNGVGGISVREDDDGSLSSTINNSNANGNTGHGIDFDENRASTADPTGNLTATVQNSSASNNTLFGIRADQQTPPGTGTLQLIGVTLTGNTGGTTTGSNVTVTQVP